MTTILKRFYTTILKRLDDLADIANLGIVAKVVFGLLIMIMQGAVPATSLTLVVLNNLMNIANQFSSISDPLIYFFKILNRLTRYAGRNLEASKEHERYAKQNTWYDYSNIGTAFLFIAAFTLFCIPATILSFHASLAWGAGLLGIGINIVTDHIYTAKKIKEEYEHFDLGNKKTNYNELNKHYKEEYYEGLLYGLVLVSLAFFLPFGSLAQTHQWSPHVTKVLDSITRGGNIAVAICSLARMIHKRVFGLYQKFPGLKKPEDVKEVVTTPIRRSSTADMLSEHPHVTLTPVPRSTSSPLIGVGHARSNQTSASTASAPLRTPPKPTITLDDSTPRGSRCCC